jgi:hypothetical protein
LGECDRILIFAGGERHESGTLLGVTAEKLSARNCLEAEDGRSVVEGHQIDGFDPEGILEVGAKIGAFFQCRGFAEQHGNVDVSTRPYLSLLCRAETPSGCHIGGARQRGGDRIPINA